MNEAHPELATLKDRIQTLLDQDIRPGFLADGGDVELVGVDADRIVQVRFVGSCQSCPASAMTMIMGIEATLKEQIPEIRFLEAVL